MKNWRTIVVLAAIFLGLGGLATWDEWQTERDEANDKNKNKVVTLKSDEITEIDFSSKATAEAAATADEGSNPADDEPKLDSDVSVALVKKDGVWRLTKPVDSLADPTTVDNLLKTITDFAWTKELDVSRDKWADFGLVDAGRVITMRVGGDGQQEFSVFVGNKAPVGYNVYFRTNRDDKVYMGSQHLLVSTAKTLYDFRDKTLVKIDETKLKSLVFERAGNAAIELVKSDGKYAITKPQPLEADGGEVQQFLDELNLMRVGSFVDQPDAAMVAAFATPAYVLSWQGETGETSALKFIEQDGKLFAAFDPSQRIYELPEDFKPKIQKDLADFQNRRILTSEILDVQSVEIDGTVYKSVAGNWYLEADAGKLDDSGKPKAGEAEPKEQSHIRALMVDLEFAKTDQFIPFDDPAGKALTAAPQHKISLGYADKNKPPMVLSLYQPVGESTDDKFIVLCTNASYLYRVSKTAFASMTPSDQKAAEPASEAQEPQADGMPLEEGESEGLNLEGPSE